MCCISECALYCVSTKIWRMPELTQLDSGKSMIRNLPPKGAAGFARLAVRSPRREPRPPAMITAIVLRVRLLTKRPDRRGCIWCSFSVPQRAQERSGLKQYATFAARSSTRASPRAWFEDAFEDYRSLPTDEQAAYPRAMPMLSG